MNAKKEVYKGKDSTPTHITEMKQCFKVYKRELRKDQCSYKVSFQTRIRVLKSNQPKDYWKLLNSHDYKVIQTYR